MKKLWLVSTWGIFILSFFCHFVYELFPSPFTAIFFPVNESIFEHVKMLFTACIIWSIIEYFLLHMKKISLHNFFLSVICTSISSIFLLLIIYLPVYYRFGEHFLVTITILFLSILLSQYLFRFVLEGKQMKVFNFIGALLIPIFYFFFGYFTFHPIKADFFYDPIHEKYGISSISNDSLFCENSVDFFEITMI